MAFANCIGNQLFGGGSGCQTPTSPNPFTKPTPKSGLNILDHEIDEDDLLGTRPIGEDLVFVNRRPNYPPFRHLLGREWCTQLQLQRLTNELELSTPHIRELEERYNAANNAVRESVAFWANRRVCVMTSKHMRFRSTKQTVLNRIAESATIERQERRAHANVISMLIENARFQERYAYVTLRALEMAVEFVRTQGNEGLDFIMHIDPEENR